MKLNDSPCFGCQKHTETCHGSCELYRQWAEWNVATRADIRRQKRQEQMMDQMDFNRSVKIGKGGR